MKVPFRNIGSDTRPLLNKTKAWQIMTLSQLISSDESYSHLFFFVISFMHVMTNQGYIFIINSIRISTNQLDTEQMIVCLLF